MVGRAPALAAAAVVSAAGTVVAVGAGVDRSQGESVAGAARGAPAAPAAATARLAVRRLTCDNSLGSARGTQPQRSDVVAGPVRLMALDRFARHARRAFRPTRERDFFAKSPLIVDAGATARLEVPPRDRAHVSFAYGVSRATSGAARVEDGAPVIAVAGTCAGSRPTGWPGSVVVDGARCVRLTVLAGDAPAATVRIPFGRATCRGGS